MRALFALSAILLTTCVVVFANTDAEWAQSKAAKDVDADLRVLRSGTDDASIHEDRDGLFELPEELEELVETHHHVREIFTRWCLADKDPEEIEKNAKSRKEAELAKLYKLYATKPSDNDRRKLTGLECNLLKKKEG
ncbi:unnamed protein product [Phytophthora fragariaefolia]|uniref:RxLR effector protein n=1 Tax=Phytophthora fragariaefolia TaxID=1490495 RepID=A0A9W7CK42_9STRA|nr:unnamed protein product [Phytophthora fragariaefolia]